MRVSSAVGCSARPKARKTLPFAASSNGTGRPTQSVVPTKCAVSSCARCSTPSGPGTARLIVSPEASASRSSAGAASSTSVAEASRFAWGRRTGPGPQPPAVAEALDEPLSLQGRDEPRGASRGRPAPSASSPTDGGCGGLDDAHEELRRTVDRLGTGPGVSHLTLWNGCSTRSLGCSGAQRQAPTAPVRGIKPFARSSGRCIPGAAAAESVRRGRHRAGPRPRDPDRPRHRRDRRGHVHDLEHTREREERRAHAGPRVRGDGSE